MNRQRLTKLYHAVLIALFMIVTTAPLLLAAFSQKQSFSLAEKRPLATLPVVPRTLKEVQAYPQNLEAYYRDHFGLRDTLVKWRNRIKVQSPDNVLIGKDDWLFLNGEGYGDPIGDYMNLNLYTEEELEQTASFLAAKAAWLKAQGIAYIFMIASDKATIYPEKLPSYIQKQAQPSATDQLVNYLKANTEVVYVHPREALLNAKDEGFLLYYPSDTHWNSYGANVAQYELAKAVQAFFPALEPILHPKEAFREAEKEGGDLALFLNLQESYSDPAYWLKQAPCKLKLEPPDAKDTDTFSHLCEEGSLKALIFRDSFFSALKPYISAYFAQATYVHKEASYDLLKELIALYKPDIVIEELVARKLPYMPELDDRFFQDVPTN